MQMMQVITLPIKQNSPTGYLLEKIDNDILIYSTENIWLLKSNNDKITLAAPELRKYYDSIHYINILRVFGDTIWLQRSSKLLPNKPIYLLVKEKGRYVHKKTLQLFHELEILSIKNTPYDNILFATDDGIFALKPKKIIYKNNSTKTLCFIRYISKR